MLETEAVWLAGVLDSEGSVVWPRRQNLHSVRLAIVNNSKPFLDRVMEVTGTGKIRMKTRKNPRHNISWTWDCYGENSRLVLQQILPWLIIKREAAEVALGIKEVTEPPLTSRTLLRRNINT